MHIENQKETEVKIKKLNWLTLKIYMSSETEVKNWPCNENNLYSNTKRYCKERMGVCVVTHSNESVEYQSTHRSIFNIDTAIAKDWYKRKDFSTDSTHLSAMKTLKMPMMILNRNMYGENGSTYTLFRQWYINRTLEDYVILIPNSFIDEIEDSMGVAPVP